MGVRGWSLTTGHRFFRAHPGYRRIPTNVGWPLWPPPAPGYCCLPGESADGSETSDDLAIFANVTHFVPQRKGNGESPAVLVGHL
jgi:hypothetical protein